MAARTVRKPKPRRHKGLSPLHWAQQTHTADDVAFANELFHRARIFSFDCSGRQLWFVPSQPTSTGMEEAILQLTVGDFAMRVGIRDLDDAVLLDPRFSTLSLPVYGRDVQHALLESLLEPLLQRLGELLGERVTLDEVELKRRRVARPSPFSLQFALYGANPHGDDPAPRLLVGSAAMGKELANRITAKIRGVEPVHYRSYAAAVPRCLNVITSLNMAVGELDALRVGDVILLEDSVALDGGRRQLVGLTAAPIICLQKGDQMTVQRMDNNERKMGKDECK
jgi:hypothetical protein